MTVPEGKQLLPWDRARFTNAHFAEEERLCWQLRLRNLSLRQIASETGLSKSTVERRLRSAFEAFREDSAAMRDQYIQLEVERLDAVQGAVLAVLESAHLVVSEGRVVRDEDGRPIPDHGPVLAAAREYRQLAESRRKLLGLDAPTKLQHTHATADVDAAVQELTELMDQADGGS